MSFFFLVPSLSFFHFPPSTADSTSYPLNTIAGSILVTLLIETSAAAIHITIDRNSNPADMYHGIRITAPPVSLPRTPKHATPLAAQHPSIPLTTPGSTRQH